MNNGPLLFLGILATLASSFWALLLAPQLQIGGQQPVLIEATGEYYPRTRPGLAQQGAEVYRAQGCVECHSQQVRQTGVSFELWLAEPGTDRAGLAATLSRLELASGNAEQLLAQAPVKLRSGLTAAAAQGLAQQLTNGEAKAQVVLAALGPDIARGWGERGTVTQDYLREYPALLGNQRVGPDLANYGARQTNAALIYAHLYNAGRTMPGSMMPPYRYLFNRRALRPGESATLPIEAGFEVTPSPEAEALVAYLLSLRSDVPLAEAPLQTPPTKPAATTAAVAAPAP